jgi:hypothetical protein
MRSMPKCEKMYRTYINGNKPRATIHFCKKVYTFRTRRTRIITVWKRLSAAFAGYIIGRHERKTEGAVLLKARH